MKQTRRHRTRNQRKCEIRKTVFLVLAMVMMWALVLTMMVTAWAEHPAEQPVNGYEYMETIQEGVVVHVFPHR